MKTSALIFLMVFSITAEAGRGKKQHNRIEQGVDNGSLTEKEAERLDKQQDKIRENRQDYKADGELDEKDKAKLERQRDRASRRIRHQKHDKQKSK